MKFNFTTLERLYLRGLLITVASITKQMPRSQQRALKRIANKMSDNSALPNLKPIERVILADLLGMGAQILKRQEAAALEKPNERLMEQVKTKSVLITSVLEKLGVELHEEPSKADPRPDTEHSGNG